MELLRTRLCEWRPVGIDALALSPRAAEPRLAVGRANGAVELWDSATWHLHSSSPGNARRSVRSFVWLPGAGEDEWRLLSAGLHKDITEWDPATLQPLVSVSSGGGAVWALCAQSERAFAACDDGSVRVFSLHGGAGSVTYESRLNVGRQRLLSITDFGPQYIFAGGSNSQITKWSLASRTCEAKMQVEQARGADTLVWALARLGSSGIASGDSLGLVQVWDPEACTVLHRFAQHQADVLTLAASPEGNVLLAGGVDAKISTFVCQPDAEERWVFHRTDASHQHDVRAIALDSLSARSGRRPYASGGVAGRLLVQELELSSARPRGAPAPAAKRPIQCSGFSPMLQTASVAQGSRLLLCQRDEHLELWYLKQPKREEAGDPLAPAELESELVLRIALSSADEGQHICASALAPSGALFAASDASGSRLFHINLEELEVRRERGLPREVRETPARALLFCGKSLLALASWSTHQVLVVDVARSAVVARLSEHAAAVSHLAGACEWLASADVSGAVHVFNLDSLEHHAQVPVGSGQGLPTALGFCAQRNHLLVVFSSHTLVVFDVEAQALAATLPPLQIPQKLLDPHERVCGVVAPPGTPDKLLLWGHGFMLALQMQPGTGGTAAAQPDGQGCQGGQGGHGGWRTYRGMKHILALTALDEAQWGSPLLAGPKPDPAAPGDEQPQAKRRRQGDRVEAMVLTFEVHPRAVEKALPPAFESKKFNRAV